MSILFIYTVHLKVFQAECCGFCFYKDFPPMTSLWARVAAEFICIFRQKSKSFPFVVIPDFCLIAVCINSYFLCTLHTFTRLLLSFSFHQFSALVFILLYKFFVITSYCWFKCYTLSQTETEVLAVMVQMFFCKVYLKCLKLKHSFSEKTCRCL